MNFWILLGVAMISSFLTLALHCFLIAGKESEDVWQEEKTMKTEEKEE